MHVAVHSEPFFLSLVAKKDTKFCSLMGIQVYVWVNVPTFVLKQYCLTHCTGWSQSTVCGQSFWKHRDSGHSTEEWGRSQPGMHGMGTGVLIPYLTCVLCASA